MARRNRRTGRPIVPIYKISGNEAVAKSHLPHARAYLMDANRKFGKNRSFAQFTDLLDGTRMHAIKRGSQFLIYVNSPFVTEAPPLVPNSTLIILQPGYEERRQFNALPQYTFTDFDGSTPRSIISVDEDFEGGFGYHKIEDEPIDHIIPHPDGSIEEVRLGHMDSRVFGKHERVLDAYDPPGTPPEFPGNIFGDSISLSIKFARDFSLGTDSTRAKGSLTFVPSTNAITSTPTVFPTPPSDLHDREVGQVEWRNGTTLLSWHGPSSRAIPEGSFYRASHGTTTDYKIKDFHRSFLKTDKEFFWIESFGNALYSAGSLLVSFFNTEFIMGACIAKLRDSTGLTPGTKPYYVVVLRDEADVQRVDDTDPETIVIKIASTDASSWAVPGTLNRADFSDLVDVSPDNLIQPVNVPVCFSSSGLKGIYTTRVLRANVEDITPWVGTSTPTEDYATYRIILDDDSSFTGSETLHSSRVYTETRGSGTPVGGPQPPTYPNPTLGSATDSVIEIPETTHEFPIASDYIEGTEEEIHLIRKDTVSVTTHNVTHVRRYVDEINIPVQTVFPPIGGTVDFHGAEQIVGLLRGGTVVDRETHHTVVFSLSTGKLFTKNQSEEDALATRGYKIHEIIAGSDTETPLLTLDNSRVFESQLEDLRWDASISRSKDENGSESDYTTFVNGAPTSSPGADQRPRYFLDTSAPTSNLGLINLAIIAHLGIELNVGPGESDLYSYPYDDTFLSGETIFTIGGPVCGDLRRGLVGFSFYNSRYEASNTPQHLPEEEFQTYIYIPEILKYEVENDVLETDTDQDFAKGLINNARGTRNSRDLIVQGALPSDATSPLLFFPGSRQNLTGPITLQGVELTQNIVQEIRYRFFSPQEESLFLSYGGILSYTLLGLHGNEYIFISPFIDHLPGYKVTEKPTGLPTDPAEPTKEHLSNIADSFGVPEFIGTKGEYLHNTIFKGIVRLGSVPG